MSNDLKESWQKCVFLKKISQQGLLSGPISGI